MKQGLDNISTVQAKGLFQRVLTACLFPALTLLAACSSVPDRPALDPAIAFAGQVEGFDDIRKWGDAPIEGWQQWRSAWLQNRGAAGRKGLPQILAISSGSENGAFTAGYLNGWSATGKRPSFDIVTGVSTGALIAPFALLGPKYDPVLHQLYTGTHMDQIARTHPLNIITGGESFADTKPLRRLVEQHVDDAFLKEVADAHRGGRRLYILTTDLDTERAAVWDMGAIAASGNAAARNLFIDVMMASAAVPGAFPPVMIKVTAAGKTFDEMHVDGGTTASAFVIPPSVVDASSSGDFYPRGTNVTILYNGRLARNATATKAHMFTIMARALQTALGNIDRETFDNYDAYAKAHGLAFTVRAIDADFTTESKQSFDPAYMAALYEYGRARGASAVAAGP